MPLEIVLGTQWGDEGKGRVVDLLAARADLVCRFNGGDNAGHTVTVGAAIFKLHLIPSGIIHPHTRAVLGCGMVINPLTLQSEAESLQQAGVDVSPSRLRISHAAHLITPAHLAIDRAQEQARRGDAIGTTGRGIGPAYTDKTARRGLRAGDILHPQEFRFALLEHLRSASLTLQKLYDLPALDVDALAEPYLEAAALLQPCITDTGLLLHQALAEGRTVLAEAAQGALLDLDHGTYPYVTSSTTTAAGALAGLGLGIRPVERVLGVSKAFQTRVGAGPFPTELAGAAADRLRGDGSQPWDEYGTTTGRPRRVGWLDGVLLRYTRRICGLTGIILTKLDVLSGLPEIPICTAYRHGGQVLADLPLGLMDLDGMEPVYEAQPGWQADISTARVWEDLPAAAQAYIRRVEQVCGVPVLHVSVGPERDQMVMVPA